VGQNAALYFSFPGTDSWTMLGSLSCQKPSAILATGWEKETIPHPFVRIGVSLERGCDIVNLEQSGAIQKENSRMDWAFHLAKDLYNFLSSFSKATPQGEMLVVPASSLNRWMSRFKAKYRINPNFVFQSD